jgi:hypothetical protein
MAIVDIDLKCTCSLHASKFECAVLGLTIATKVSLKSPTSMDSSLDSVGLGPSAGGRTEILRQMQVVFLKT